MIQILGLIAAIALAVVAPAAAQEAQVSANGPVHILVGFVTAIMAGDTARWGPIIEASGFAAD